MWSLLEHGPGAFNVLKSYLGCKVDSIELDFCLISLTLLNASRELDNCTEFVSCLCPHLVPSPKL